MDILRFLTEVQLRTRTQLRPEIDPIGIIMTRVGLFPHTPESRALRKATLAVIAGKGEMGEPDLWALSQDALTLLDAFAYGLEHGRYRQQDLRAFAVKLQERDQS